MGECADRGCAGGVVSTDKGEAPWNFGSSPTDIEAVAATLSGAVATPEAVIAVVVVVVVVIASNGLTSVLLDPGEKGRNELGLCSPQWSSNDDSKNDFMSLFCCLVTKGSCSFVLSWYVRGTLAVCCILFSWLLSCSQ